MQGFGGDLVLQCEVFVLLIGELLDCPTKLINTK